MELAKGLATKWVSVEVCCLTKLKKVFQCLREEREAMCHYFYLRRLANCVCGVQVAYGGACGCVWGVFVGVYGVLITDRGVQVLILVGVYRVLMGRLVGSCYLDVVVVHYFCLWCL